VGGNFWNAPPSDFRFFYRIDLVEWSLKKYFWDPGAYRKVSKNGFLPPKMSISALKSIKNIFPYDLTGYNFYMLWPHPIPIGGKKEFLLIVAEVFF